MVIQLIIQGAIMTTKLAVLKTTFSGINFDKYSNRISEFTNILAQRANQKGQFLNWVDLPKFQLSRVDELFAMAENFKNQTNNTKLSILGIGGSKHTVEHMLSINGLNVLGDKIEFYSDVDSISFERFLTRINHDVLSSNYMVASKSGSTFETKDGFLRIQQMLNDAYIAKGQSKEEAAISTAKHFIAVTDANAEMSELRRTSIEQSWIGDLFIHDDVGGRFSAFDDHAIFALIFAGMTKENLISLLSAAQEVSEISLSNDFDANDALKQGIFWADAKLNGTDASVHQYMSSIFENTVYWHAQMQNESVKDTLKQVAKVPDAMHHSAEAHFNPANKLVFALTVPNDKGVCSENAQAYIGALTKSYDSTAALFVEELETSKLGLSAAAAGALTQLRAFATVYQEIVQATMTEKELPEVLDSVLQPYVEFYKKNLKGGVVIPGRIS